MDLYVLVLYTSPLWTHILPSLPLPVPWVWLDQISLRMTCAFIASVPTVTFHQCGYILILKLGTDRSPVRLSSCIWNPPALGCGCYLTVPSGKRRNEAGILVEKEEIKLEYSYQTSGPWRPVGGSRKSEHVLWSKHFH